MCILQSAWKPPYKTLDTPLSVVDDCESWLLVQECRDFEEAFGTCFVNKILIGDSNVMCMKGLRKSNDKLDRLKRL